MEKKPNETRGGIAFVFLILVGLGIGFLIKRVHIGLIIGLALGLFAAGIFRKR
jgi:F0F1-type ATP synthase assembly protein I